MKRKLIQAAIGVGLAASASVAMAFAPTSSADYTVFISGSSAVSPTVLSFTIDNVCDHTAGIDVFRRSSAKGFGNDWGVACKVNTSTTGVSAARNVLFLKRDAGGSGYGVTPVTNGVALGVLDTSTGAGTNCPNAATTQQTANGTSYNQYVCNSGNVTLTPDAGFSDVEPDKFRGFNAPAGLPDFDPSTALPFTAQPVAALTGGIPVSLNFRNALQVVQFPAVSVCNPKNAGLQRQRRDRGLHAEPHDTAEIRTGFIGGLGDWSSSWSRIPAIPTARDPHGQPHGHPRGGHAFRYLWCRSAAVPPAPAPRPPSAWCS